MKQLVRRTLGPLLIYRVPRDHEQPDLEFRHRRVVAACTLVLGATLLGFSLATHPGDSVFYPLTAGVALVWFAGGFWSGPLYLGYAHVRGRLRRPVIAPIALGVLAGAVFLLGGLIVRDIPLLRSLVTHVLAHAQQGNIALVAVLALVNGAAEEVFFRGALFAAIGRRYPVVISTVIYAVVTIATGNLMLVFAAVVMGFVFALQRRASGGILASMLTHLTWSAIMILALPPVLGI